MQPSFIPWPGWFSLVLDSDVFVLLDDVQFSKQSWQQRNYLLSPSAEPILISVPVETKGQNFQLINEVNIAKSFNREKLIRQIKQNYSKSYMSKEVMPIILNILEKTKNEKKLVNLNCEFIFSILSYLGIEKEILKSSQINVRGARGEYVANICRYLNSDNYLSPLGAIDYLKIDMSFFKNININIQNYNMPTYPRYKKTSCFSTSLIDMLFNCDKEKVLEFINVGNKGYKNV